VTWLDWRLDPQREAFLAFVRRAFEQRRRNPVFARSAFLSGNGDVRWLRPDGGELSSIDWHDAKLQCLGVWITAAAADGADGRDALLLVNGAAHSCLFQLPSPPEGTRWRTLLSSVTERARGPRAAALRVAAHACVWLGAGAGHE
jgi:glycogen operon protein